MFISLINTLTGMKIDINRRTFALANKTGGMSGPAVKPVAVRMVYQVANAVSLPIIGMGGIATAEDALEIYYGRCYCSVCGNCKPFLTLMLLWRSQMVFRHFLKTESGRHQ